MQTANANQINQNYSSMGDRMNKFLAARGFGKSGTTGKVQMQTELGRQGALATNASNAAGQQLQLDSGLLSDALAMAFANPGSTSTDTTRNIGATSGFGWGLGANAGFAPA